MAEPIVWNNFNTGVADSPHVGHGLMRNVELDAFTGALKAQKEPDTVFHTNTTGTFTAVAATDVCTSTAFTNNANTTGVAVVLTTTGTLPAGLSTGTIYFINRIDLGAGTFEFCTTIANADAGTQIDITDTGTGTHTITTINPGTINHIVRDPNAGTRFYHDSNGRAWYNESPSAGVVGTRLLHNSAIDTGGASVTNGSGQGLAILGTSDASATYLFSFRNALIDVVAVTGATQLEAPSWSNAWQTMNTGAGSSNSHHAVTGQDGIIYYCDTRYVGSIRENAGSVFAPGTGSTYTFTQDALDLLQYEVANWIEELGIYLLIAGNSYGWIYPWDRLSDSFITPIIVPEKQVSRLKNIGGLVYILAGTWGNIYSTTGEVAKHIKKLPDQMVNQGGDLLANPITWGGIEASMGNLLFGVSGQTSANDGVYMLYPDGRLIMENTPSPGARRVTAIYALNNFYDFGYASGADAFLTTRYANFECVAQSMLFKAGTKTKPATYSELELQLAKPATSGSVRIGYRADTSSSFTTISTFVTDSTNTSFKSDAGLINIENIQLQVEYHGTVEIVEIRLLP